MRPTLIASCIECLKQYPKGLLLADEGQRFYLSCNITFNHAQTVHMFHFVCTNCSMPSICCKFTTH